MAKPKTRQSDWDNPKDNQEIVKYNIIGVGLKGEILVTYKTNAKIIVVGTETRTNWR